MAALQLWADEIGWHSEIWEVYILILIPVQTSKKFLSNTRSFCLKQCACAIISSGEKDNVGCTYVEEGNAGVRPH